MLVLLGVWKDGCRFWDLGCSGWRIDSDRQDIVYLHPSGSALLRLKYYVLFDEDPASVAVAAFGDAAALGFTARGVFARGETEVAHELPGVDKSNKISYFRDDHHGGDELKSFQAHDGIDDWLVAPIGVEVFHVFFVTGDARVELVDLIDEFFKDDAVGRKFADGFWSAAAGAGASNLGLLGSPGGGLGGVFRRTVMAGVVGGTTAVIGGGKFANGAYTAAFQHLLNADIFYENSYEGYVPIDPNKPEAPGTSTFGYDFKNDISTHTGAYFVPDWPGITDASGDLFDAVMLFFSGGPSAALRNTTEVAGVKVAVGVGGKNAEACNRGYASSCRSW